MVYTRLNLFPSETYAMELYGPVQALDSLSKIKRSVDSDTATVQVRRDDLEKIIKALCLPDKDTVDQVKLQIQDLNLDDLLVELALKKNDFEYGYAQYAAFIEAIKEKQASNAIARLGSDLDGFDDEFKKDFANLIKALSKLNVNIERDRDWIYLVAPPLMLLDLLLKPSPGTDEAVILELRDLAETIKERHLPKLAAGKSLTDEDKNKLILTILEKLEPNLPPSIQDISLQSRFQSWLQADKSYSYALRKFLNKKIGKNQTHALSNILRSPFDLIGRALKMMKTAMN